MRQVMISLAIVFIGVLSKELKAKPSVSWIQEHWSCEDRFKTAPNLQMKIDLWYPERETVVLNWDLQICDQVTGDCFVEESIYPARFSTSRQDKAWPLSAPALFEGLTANEEVINFRITKGPSAKDRRLKGYLFMRKEIETEQGKKLNAIVPFTEAGKKIIFVSCDLVTH